MIIKLVEVFAANKQHTHDKPTYSLREVFVNPEHVTCLREDTITAKKLEANLLPEDLNQQQRFTKLHLNRGLSGIDLTVVGDPNTIKEKLSVHTKTLLKG